MNQLDKEKYIARYSDRLATYGYDPKTLGWGGGEVRQEIRYKNLLDIASFTARQPHSLMDVGCGFADLLSYLEKTKSLMKSNYFGVDINEKLLMEAQFQHNGEVKTKCYDILSDALDTCIENISGPYDLVVESGIFNFKLEREDQEQYISSMLKRMFDLSRLGVAADFMTTYVDWESEGAFHMEPSLLFDIAYKITRKIIVRHDYLPYEFCVYLIR